MTSTNHSGTAFEPSGRLHFGVSLVGPAAETDFESLRTLAQTAERGLFSLLALDERYWQGGDPGPASDFDPAGSHDVATLLAALAAVTRNIGLVASAGPDYDDPADMVHRMASLDHVCGGRAAWSLLPDGTSWRGEEPTQGAGGSAREVFLNSAQRIWELWGGTGAPASGLEKLAVESQGAVEPLGAFEHSGQSYSVGLGPVAGPAPRYRPVLFHGGAGAQELDFAARHADVVVSPPAGLGDALDLRRDVTARTLDAGRSAAEVRIFQAATFILAHTPGEAQEQAARIRAQLPPEAWDEEAFIGSYADVADRLLDYVRAGAVDGFTITPWLNPSELADVVNHLVPELQERGIYPLDHTDGPLRELLGLQDPAARPAGVSGADPSDDLHLDIRMELVVQKLPG